MTLCKRESPIGDLERHACLLQARLCLVSAYFMHMPMDEQRVQEVMTFCCESMRVLLDRGADLEARSNVGPSAAPPA